MSSVSNRKASRSSQQNAFGLSAPVELAGEKARQRYGAEGEPGEWIDQAYIRFDEAAGVARRRAAERQSRSSKDSSG